MSVCHTVQVNESSSERYQASSPDEICLVEFCHRVGVSFDGDKKSRGSANKIREVVVQSANKTRKYEIMHVLDFDSTRKRMSVILKDTETGKYTLFCKGADSAMFKKCTSGNIQSTEASIRNFAHNGWRTLALGYRALSDKEYTHFDRILADAYNDIVARSERIASAFDEIESDMILVGATAIEDKLQEEVAETLEALRDAGIKIWVLTGDKLETAINISQSCGHFSDDMYKLMLTNASDPVTLENNLNRFSEMYYFNVYDNLFVIQKINHFLI